MTRERVEKAYDELITATKEAAEELGMPTEFGPAVDAMFGTVKATVMMAFDSAESRKNATPPEPTAPAPDPTPAEVGGSEQPTPETPPEEPKTDG